ncbi:MAG: F0F1 ATP synthase subunit A [Planctomycetes bacterium]|nr:F0F1 ATP synthase subunit A [Planctomycetota bacterium]
MTALLHIKDSYYFEVPKFLYRSDRSDRGDFPDYWVRLDDEYQDWEAVRQIEAISGNAAFENIPNQAELLDAYHGWRHEGKNFAKPFDRFLEESTEGGWFQQQLALGKYAKQLKSESESLESYKARQQDAKPLQSIWTQIKTDAEDVAAFNQEAPAWSADKIDDYNSHLNGKILIPQPFGQLKNNYEPESGFCISKFMILELAVAAILVFLFSKLASYVSNGRPAKGKLWNMLETFLLFIRDEVARPAIGKHDADRFVPLLWTIFLFVLGCNLFGMLPWVGAPTGSFSVTLGLALVTFATVIVAGSIRFGVVGFWKNQVPSMGLPLPLAVVLVPMIFAIEVLSLLIKHAVLGIRLLANMVAGHLVLLAILGMAVAAAPNTNWALTAVITVVSSVLFSCLELFVAFLQAYVFTFLSALFIGSAVHHH